MLEVRYSSLAPVSTWSMSLHTTISNGAVIGYLFDTDMADGAYVALSNRLGELTLRV